MSTLDQLAELVGGKSIGQSDLIISGVSEIQYGKPGTISFLANLKYKKYLESTRASAVIVSDSSLLNEQNGIVVQNPQLAFSKILNVFRPRLTIKKGIHPTAVSESSEHLGDAVSVGANAVIKANVTIGEGTNVGPNSVIGCTAVIDSSVLLGDAISVGANAVIEANVTIGERTRIGANSVIGRNAVIGEKCRIHPRVTIYHECNLGNRVVIFSGSVIGSDGFGFVTEEDIHYKIPQIGKVIIGSDVEIGANCTIDRATIGETIIGNMTILDNLVHIAHNVKIGMGCLLAAGVGIAGSVTIEDFCILAGQSGVIPHVSIGPKSIIAVQSGVTKSLKGGEIYSGMPARKIREQNKKDAVLSSISMLKSRFEKLEKLVLKNDATTLVSVYHFQTGILYGSRTAYRT